MSLKALHETQVSMEKFRIALGNRVDALTRGVDSAEKPIPEFFTELTRIAEDMESKIDKEIEKELETWPVWGYWLKHVKGVGPSLAGQILALLLPPLPERGPSTWYKAAGLIPEKRPDGESRLPRARKGEGKITYHPWLRRCLYNLITSLIRTDGYYRQIYDSRKDQLLRQHAWHVTELLDTWNGTSEPVRGDMLVSRFGIEKVVDVCAGKISATFSERIVNVARSVRLPTAAKGFAFLGPSDQQWPLIRIDHVARWKTVKFFLAHLWEKWLESLGQDSRKAYVVEKLGHTYEPPPDLNLDGTKI